MTEPENYPTCPTMSSVWTLPNPAEVLEDMFTHEVLLLHNIYQKSLHIGSANVSFSFNGEFCFGRASHGSWNVPMTECRGLAEITYKVLRTLDQSIHHNVIEVYNAVCRIHFIPLPWGISALCSHLNRGKNLRDWGSYRPILLTIFVRKVIKMID